MSRLDDLPPDLRATLSLLLDRGKSYAEIADMLAIPESTVRDRAHAALDALSAGPSTARSGVSGPGSSRGTSPGERSTRTPRSSSPPSRAASPDSPPPPSTARARVAAAPPSSRRAGALLLLALLAIVIVAVVLISGGGSGSGKASSTGSNASSTSSTSSKTSTASKPTEDKRITLSSPEPSSKSIGAVEVLSEGSKYAYYIAATNLPPSKGFFYAVWLYNSPTSHEAVSKAPNVGSDGRLQGGALLPSNAGEYHEMLLTRETNSDPTTPGPVVLKGAFALH